MQTWNVFKKHKRVLFVIIIFTKKAIKIYGLAERKHLLKIIKRKGSFSWKFMKRDHTREISLVYSHLGHTQFMC